MKKLIGGGLMALALGLGLTGCSATGGAPINTTTATYSASLGPQTTVPPVPVILKPLKYSLGDAVQNGSLRFTVDSTRRAMVVHDRLFSVYYSAPGEYEYVIVKLTVQNVDTQPVFFYYDSQTLDLHGQQVSTDSGATGALNHNVTPIIQPGLAIPVELAFIVPKGAQPEAIMFSDALYAISNPLSSAAAATRVELVTP